MSYSYISYSKITRAIYPENHPNHTCGYRLITRNQQTLCTEILMSFNSGQLQISERAVRKQRTITK